MSEAIETLGFSGYPLQEARDVVRGIAKGRGRVGRTVGLDDDTSEMITGGAGNHGVVGIN